MSGRNRVVDGLTNNRFFWKGERMWAERGEFKWAPAKSFKAFIYMLFNNVFLDKLVKIDFQKELISNEQLASSEDESAMLSKRNNIRKITIDRAKLLWKRLCLSFLIIVYACIFAFIIRFIFQNALQNSKNLPKVFGLISIMSFSVATLGRLGWASQSIKNDTVIDY